MPNPFLKQQALPLAPRTLLERDPRRRVGPAGPRATPWNYYSGLIKRPDGSDSYAFSEGEMAGTKVARHALVTMGRQV